MKLSKNDCLLALSEADETSLQWICAIYLEMKRAEQKHPNWPKDDYIHAAAIVAEESGELIREALQATYETGRYFDMHQEACQTAAMSLRFLVELKERDEAVLAPFQHQKGA